MQTKFNLYPKEQLPENFKFPQSYIDLSSNMEKINELEYFPWCFEELAQSQGVKFYIGNEKVWLSDGIPAEFIRFK